jgi:hypothetical protein
MLLGSMAKPSAAIVDNVKTLLCRFIVVLPVCDFIVAVNGSGYTNARWPKAHLTGALLGKPLQLLRAQELKRWRDGLLAKVAPTTINRILQRGLRRAGSGAKSVQNWCTFCTLRRKPT